jgi:HSP20 family protein
MAVVRHDPFDELKSIQEQMNRLFDIAGDRVSDEALKEGAWQPAVDIYEDETCFILKIDLPGIDQQDIGVKIEGNTLTLHGERKLEKDFIRERYHRLERYYGPFQRSFSLPHTIDQTKVKASCEKGVLTITLPKKTESITKPLVINVT